MSVNSKMTAIANATRALDGSTGKLTLDGIASKLGVEKTNVEAALAALVEKEVDVPAGSTSAALASLIASIEAGGGAKITSGWFFPTSNITLNTTTPYSIAHGLGEQPDFAIVFKSREPSTTKNYWLSVYATGIAEGWSRGEVQMTIWSGANNYSLEGRPRGRGETSNVGVSVDSTNINIYADNIPLTSNYHLWIAGVTE